MRPCNRHILIKPIEQEEKDSAMVLVPDGYKAKTNPHIMATVIDWSDDVDLPLYESAKVLVNSAMVEEIKIGDRKYHMVLENYVLGIDN